MAITLTGLCWKLKCIKSFLKTLNRENYSNIQERVRETNSLLQIAQVRALEDPSPQSFLEEKLLHDKWNFLRLLEESYFRQKSRINWLQEGDLNTTYFHRVCQARACFNAIRSFLLASGDVITDPIEMSVPAVGHFKSVLGPDFLPRPSLVSPPEWFRAICNFRFSLQQKTYMLKLPSSEEINKPFFKLNSNKAP